MRISLRICAAAAAIALGSVQASACFGNCGYGYGGYGGYGGYTGYNGYYGYNGYAGYNGNGYYGYNGYAGYNGNGYYGFNGSNAPSVVVIYAAPPVYAYAPPVSVYYAPSAYERFYSVAAFGGPRWGGNGYGNGGYYTAPLGYGPRWRPRAYGYHAGPRFYARPYRAYARGPVRRWRHW
jgi:hypothetical protein